MSKLKTRLLSSLSLLVFCFLFNIGQVDGQLNFLELDNQEYSYKKILKKAKSENKLVFVGLYRSLNALNTTTTDSLKYIVDQNNLITDMVDAEFTWNHPLLARLNFWSNPSFLIIHPDDIILSVHSDLSTVELVKHFIGKGISLKEEYELLLQNTDSNDPNSLEKLISFYARINYSKGVEQSVNKYIKKLDKYPPDKNVVFLSQIATQCPCGNRMQRLIDQNKQKLIQLEGEDVYYNIKQGFIVTNLRDKGMLEPYYVWERYERELDAKADSLYRLFAINYYRYYNPDLQLMVNEIFDFLSFYPRSPWELQEKLFEIAILNSKTNEDYGYLLDLVSYQVAENENYRNLDFRAYLLYKLGQNEMALKLLQRINELALTSGIRYQSLLYTLK